MSSNAVGLERVSKVVGYKITKGNFATSTPNLPQRVGVLCEANEANQGTLDLTPWELTTAQAAGLRYGFGSPAYLLARILRPVGGPGIGGISVIFYPQAKASGATAKIVSITPSGTATGAGTHYIKIAGRDSMDGQSYQINIAEGDTTDDITAKIEDAINNVLGAPVIATSDTYEALLTTKWNGLTAQGVNVEVDTDGADLGITYTINVEQAGAGTPAVTTALNLFGEDWVTLVINTYGTNASVCNELQTFNGIPDPTNPTGRFAGIIMKPFVAITGSVDDENTTFTDARLNDVTIAIAPAPLSKGLAMEAAANMAVLQARIAQDSPNLDVGDQTYADMPTPATIGTMMNYEQRDAYVKKGNSTVELSGGRYKVCDFVTTYHPEGELPPQFRYVRNLMLDFNIRFGYYLLEQINVVGHSISNDSDVVNAEKTIKPKQWKAIVSQYADDLTKRALIADPAFMQDSIVVNIGTTNPDRFETFYRYKRTGVVRIASTTAEAGFNFGSL